MGFKTFASGDVLTASDVNTYLMRQAVITCTAATRPASPSEGMTIYETDTNRYRSYDGSAWRIIAQPGAWVAYTPTLTGTGWALVNGTAVGAYTEVGDTIIWRARITFGSSSTYGTTGQVTISLPAESSAIPGHNTQIEFIDASPTAIYPGIGRTVSGTTMEMTALLASGTYAQVASLTSTVPFTWASGDIIDVAGVYQRATGA